MSRLCILILLISTKAFCFEYVLPKPQNDKDLRQQYRLELVQLALDKTQNEDGKKTAKFSDYVVNQSRAVNEIIQNTGVVTIMGTEYTKERAAKMYPINVEILNKINQYRVSFVNKNYLTQYQSIKTIDDLKKFPLCRKKDWFDGVYGPNGFKIELGPDYEGIFKMLNSGRCVWFPRGAHEISDESKQFKDLLSNVVIDDKIAITYEKNIIFFVSKENKQYGDRIEKGLNLSKKDGSFKKLFENNFKSDIENVKLENRKIFKIDQVFD